MSELRRLKLELLADVTKFSKALVHASNSSDSFGNKLKSVAKAGALAFAGLATAVSVAAIAMGRDMVKAALEDEAGQKRLAKALKNTTHATDAQVTAVENYIRSAQLANGFSDTKLRNTFNRLARSTHDLTKAQKLTNLAMDVSRATGKDLETVAMSLGKAYDGNLGALKRLGIPLSDTVLKAKDVAGAFREVEKTVTGSAAAANATYAGKLELLNQAWQDLKENLGMAVIPGLVNLADYLRINVIPLLGQTADALAGKPNSVTNKLQMVAGELGYGDQSRGYKLGEKIKEIADRLGGFFQEMSKPNAQGAAGTINSIADSLAKIAWALGVLQAAYEKSSGVINWMNGHGKLLPEPPAWIKKLGLDLGLKPAKHHATGGMIGGPSIVGERGPELFVPSGQGRIIPNNQLRSGGGVTIVMNGVIDGESARRTLQKLIQDSSKRTGAVNWLGSAV